MRLLLTAPQVAFRDCDHCQAFVYDEKTGKMQTYGQGKPVPRPKSCPSPCRLPHVGCPKGTPESPKSLNEANWLAYEHYHECRAVGQFPDDPIVRRNARVIRQIEDQREANERQEFYGMLVQLSGLRVLR